MEFDLSEVKLSANDLRRGLVLPKKPSKELAELIGILIGDGYIYNNYNKYRIGIVGNPKTDFEYFTKIQKLIFKLFNLNTKIKKVGRGLRIIFGSKGTFYFLTSVIGLYYGMGKGEKTKIPPAVSGEKWVNHAIRGVFDSDGSIFTSHKKGAPNYPCIELTTTSPYLANQVKKILIKRGFRVAGVRKYQYKQSKLISHKVSLYGHKNIKLWYEKIGFSNPLKQEKLKKIRNGNAGI